MYFLFPFYVIPSELMFPLAKLITLDYLHMRIQIIATVVVGPPKGNMKNSVLHH